ncbi:MAG: helix-turn-helix domain-containing protein, partial [Salinisphaeraceae bacterium]|nr:helix-turn-helix domain-containing protein [Salinisphaeraceae bacterium]
NLCALPYNQLTRAAGNKPELQMRLMRHISQDLSTALSLGGDFTADQRLAAFFLHLQERELQRRMVTSDRIDLVMSRRDIASYLRLAPETVSRIIKRFTNAGWIQSKPRALFILDHTAMTQLAEPVGILNHPATSLASAA